MAISDSQFIQHAVPAAPPTLLAPCHRVDCAPQFPLSLLNAATDNQIVSCEAASRPPSFASPGALRPPPLARCLPPTLLRSSLS